MKKLINLFHYVSLVIIALASIIILFLPSLNGWEKVGLYIVLTVINDLINFKTMVKIVDRCTGRDSLSELKVILGMQEAVPAYGNPMNYSVEIIPMVNESRLRRNFDLVIGQDGLIKLVDKMTMASTKANTETTCPKCGKPLAVREWHEDDYLVEILKTCDCDYIYHWSYGTTIKG